MMMTASAANETMSIAAFPKRLALDSFPMVSMKKISSVN
jgi:hypothetical protein